VLAGEFQIVNPWLLRDLVSLGIWDDQMKNRIIAAGGSVQNVPGIPDELRALYKTVWELSQKCVIDLAADRGAFICQSQSLNIHLSAPTMAQLTSMQCVAISMLTALTFDSFYGASDPSLALSDPAQVGVAGLSAFLDLRPDLRSLKTGQYYLRTRPAVAAIQVRVAL